MAAVSSGESPAMIAKAPAETMGGIPDSRMATRLGRLLSPKTRQKRRARSGATTSLIERPSKSGDSTSGRRRRGQLVADRDHDHGHQGGGQIGEQGDRRGREIDIPADESKNQGQKRGEGDDLFDNRGKRWSLATPIQGKNHRAVSRQGQKGAELVIKNSVRDARFTEKGLHHGDSEERSVAQRHQKQEGSDYLPAPVADSRRKQDNGSRNGKHGPGHDDRAQDITGEIQLRHLEQDQGGQGNMDDKEVEHLGGFLREPGEAAHSHADEEEGNGEDKVFHEREGAKTN